MDVIKALTERVSVSKLCIPAPSASQLATLLEAANRAADHGCLCPWRFKVVQGSGLEQLGQLFLKGALADDPSLSEAQQQRTASLPMRAPMIIIATAFCQAHPKVPELEQIVATGAAVQNIINTAFGLGVGAFWRTGAMAYNATVKAGLSLADNEHIVGFVYLGTPVAEAKSPKAFDAQLAYENWP